MGSAVKLKGPVVKVFSLLAHSHLSMPSGQRFSASAEVSRPNRSMSMSSLARNVRLQFRNSSV